MADTISPKQQLVLLAAAEVDHLGFPSRGTSIENGVFRGLRLRGLLAEHRHGYAITEMGRAVLAMLERRRPQRSEDEDDHEDE